MQRKSSSIILLDTSVILAAYGSSGGGSSMIIDNQGRAYRCIVTITIFAEMMQKAEKFKTDEDTLRAWIKSKRVMVVQSPNEEEKQAFDTIVSDKKDRHVLAAAQKHRVSCLLSYDRAHIITSSVKRVLRPILVMTPKEFLQSGQK